MRCGSNYNQELSVSLCHSQSCSYCWKSPKVSTRLLKYGSVNNIAEAELVILVMVDYS